MDANTASGETPPGVESDNSKNAFYMCNDTTKTADIIKEFQDIDCSLERAREIQNQYSYKIIFAVVSVERHLNEYGDHVRNIEVCTTITELQGKLGKTSYVELRALNTYNLIRNPDCDDDDDDDDGMTDRITYIANTFDAAEKYVDDELKHIKERLDSIRKEYEIECENSVNKPDKIIIV